MDITIIIQ